MTRKNVIDLVGRAAEHLDINARKTPSLDFTPPLMPERASEAVIADAQAAPPPPPPLQDPLIVQAAAQPDGAPDDAAPPPATETVAFDWPRLAQSGLLTPDTHRSLMAEEFRLIKRPLLRSAFGRDARMPRYNTMHVAMITSPAPGDGKTFTAINLALSIAFERDIRVLLVDADARRMGLSRTLGVTRRKGIVDVLTTPSLSIGDVIVRTDIPNLSIVPAGQTADAPSEIFASHNMARTMADIAARYADHFIIFDAPPVLASSDAGALASHVGQVIMIVRANETSRQAVTQAVTLVEACPNISFLLNRVTMSAGADRFGHYGYYQEGAAQ